MYLFKLFFIFAILMHEASAFNWVRCKKKWIDTTVGMGGIISTTSYISSTGECAMIGMLDHDKKVYVAQNAELLQIDIARGNGEYLNNYAALAGCDSKKLSPLLQNSYDQIFHNYELNPEKIYQEIERLIIENNKTNELCRPIV